jgi:prepilin-type processing-associated H-X9-DG protein
MQYTQDYDEAFPVGTYDGPSRNDSPWVNANGTKYGWNHMVFPYVKSVQLFKCPSAGESEYNSQAWDNNGPYGITQYAMNANLTGGGARSGRVPRSTKLAQLSFPTATIMAKDGSKYGGAGADSYDSPNMDWSGGYTWDNNQAWNTDIAQPGNFSERAPLARHLDGGNYLFSDGHVKWYSAAKMRPTVPQSGMNGFTRTPNGSDPTYCPDEACTRVTPEYGL